MKKISTQFIIEAKDKASAIFEGIISKIKKTGDTAENQGGKLDKVAGDVDKLAVSNKKLAAEQRKLEISSKQLAVAEEQLAAKYKKIARDAKTATTSEQKLKVQQDRLSASARSLANDQKRAATALKQVALNAKISESGFKKTGSSAKKASGGINSFTRTVKRAGTALIAFFGIRAGINFAIGIVKQADAFANLQARIKLVTDGNNDYISSNIELFKIAQLTRVEFSDLAVLFSRTNEAIIAMGGSSKDTLNLVEVVGKATRISGTSAVESQAAIRQLIQGLQSGVLRGEEFNSVMEQTPRLARAIAAGMEVPIESLRALATEGKLTSSAVVQALLSQKEALSSEFDQLPTLVTQVITKIKNTWQQGIGQLNEKSKFGEDLVLVFEKINRILAAFVDSMEVSSFSIKEAFDGILTATLFIAGGVRASFNIITGAINLAGAAATQFAVVLLRFLSIISFGELSADFKKHADLMQETSNDLGRAFLEDAKDIGNSFNLAFNGLPEKEQDLTRIGNTGESAFKKIGNTAKSMAAKIKSSFSSIDTDVKSDLDRLNDILLDFKTSGNKSIEDIKINDIGDAMKEIGKNITSGDLPLANRQIDNTAKAIQSLFERTELNSEKTRLAQYIEELKELRVLSGEEEKNKVRLQAEFDQAAGIESANSLVRAVQDQVKPIVVPVVFQNQDGTSFSDSSFDFDDESLAGGTR